MEVICVAQRGREAGEKGGRSKYVQRLEPRSDDKTNCLTGVHKDNLLFQSIVSPHQLNPAPEFGSQPRQQNRVYSPDATSPAVTRPPAGVPRIPAETYRIRRLTPTECARLQTIPDWYEWRGKFDDGSVKETSDTQRYKMLGNGWCVEVIKHLLSFLPLPQK